MSEAQPLLLQLLREPVSAIPYAMSTRIAELRPERHVLDTSELLFDPWAHARAGRARADARSDVHHRCDYRWEGPDDAAYADVSVAWLDVTWNDEVLEVIRLTYDATWGPRTLHTVVASNAETARAYFADVCSYCAEVRDEILVYANGCWQKSAELFAAIRSTSFADVVLADGLAERIRHDFDAFVAARAQYARWNIPWKRGALFVGPPGNGKTLCIKALVNHLGLPCLYVQSFAAPRVPPQVAIREVFTRARRSAPCVMVLEDLDSLVDSEGRSFFLNELDGFACNDGLITIGSSNHPERLDPALADRPSRFDRTYRFALPGVIERRRYAQTWNDRLTPELRLAESALESTVELTDAFSFAYLKELFAASLMRFASEEHAGPFASVVRAEAESLRVQMQSASVLSDVDSSTVPTETDPYARWERMMRRRRL